MSQETIQTEVLIIGGGPAGSVAGAELVRKGRRVLCVEKGYFPRFVIGESLLPRCNALLDEVGMLDAVKRRAYQVKPAAMFLRGEERERFCFADALPGDHPDTFQVPRGDFDQTLATEARRMGLDLRFGHEVRGVEFGEHGATVDVHDLERDQSLKVEAKFVLDCSGYGRVLPRLLDLERPAVLPPRVSCFTQIEGDLRPDGDGAGDIWICVHPKNGWIWIIPFADGRTSIGMVCDPDAWASLPGGCNRDKLFTALRQEPNVRARIRDAVPVAPTRVIENYSKRVDRFHGDRWALVGNASDFLDPVFSSGVTLALESAVLASKLTHRTLEGEKVDWETEYDGVLHKAVGVFLAFIESWYRRDLEAIFFAKSKPEGMKKRITSILGGHVLRDDNSLVREPMASLQRLAEAAR